MGREHEQRHSVEVYPKENGCTRYLIRLGSHHMWIYAYTFGHVVRDPEGFQIHESLIDNYPTAELLAVGHLEGLK